MQTSNGYIAAFGRLALAAIFLWSGLGKLMDHAGTVGYMSSVGLPLAEVGYWLAIIIEILGGIALVAGYQTRIVALVLAAFSVVTALAFHAHFGDLNQAIHFMKNIAIAGGFLQVFALGAGAFSLDNTWSKRAA